MRLPIFKTTILGCILFAFCFFGFKSYNNVAAPSGAFLFKHHADTSIMILLSDGYFSLTAFNSNSPAFYYCWGGPIQLDNNSAKINIEFNTMQPKSVGQVVPVQMAEQPNKLIFNGDDFTPIDKEKNAIHGVWRIEARDQNGEMKSIPLAARRTLKILTGSHFQWIAINIEDGGFFGTGGGSYSFKDGKYTEQIQFFSRDSSRVGQSLAFDGKLENGQWHHSGKSSRGQAIHEVWAKLKGQ